MTVAVSYKSPKLAHCVLKSHLHVVRSRPVQTIKRSGVADCKIVSIATFAKVCFDQENKGCRAPTGKAPQYANPTIAHTSYHALNAPISSPTAHSNRTSKATKWQRGGSSKKLAGGVQSNAPYVANLPAPPTRKPRLLAAKIKRLMSKQWRDLTKTEKAALSIARIAAVGGMTVNLNFGFRRSTLIEHHNPRRIFEKHLNKHLNAMGLSGQRFALTLEVTPEDRYGMTRLHVHGAIETAHLSQDERARLEEALCRAASIATGSLGGERQLVMKSFTCPSGWIDYCLKNQRRTKCELQVEDLWILPNAMRRAAKSFHEEANRERIAA